MTMQYSVSGRDPVSLEAAELARDLVRASSDGEAFFHIVWRQAENFLRGVTIPNDPGAPGQDARYAALIACLAKIAAAALETAYPEDGFVGPPSLTAFFDFLIENEITF
jgi:hypothetical protein